MTWAPFMISGNKDQLLEHDPSGVYFNHMLAVRVSTHDGKGTLEDSLIMFSF